MSMSVITLTSSSKTSISNPPEAIKNVREASFSSYLDGAEETFVLKLGASRTQPASEREIDVFDAEKYFNDGLNHSTKANTKNFSKKRDDPIEIFAIKENPPIAALSIRSESSWNSRSALLHTFSKTDQPRKVSKKSFLATIGCNCSCIANNSTDRDERVGENSSVKSRKEDKTSDQKSEPDYGCVKFDEPELRVNSNGHFSFPVFKNKIPDGKKNCVSMDKKITMTWDAIAPNPAEEIKIPSISSEMHNDSDSDASSDLFEIESFSKNNPFLSRQESDGCRTPTTCYAPSEASIEWSVITASAADFTVLSDSEEVTSNITIPCPKKAVVHSKLSPFKEIPKLRPGILSGCKNQKAVSVAGDAQRTRKLSFDVKSRQQSFDARVLSRSRPANLLYT